MKKYEFTGETKFRKGVYFRQIRALRDIDNPFKFISKGKLGGWIESEDNLDQDSDSWIEENIYLHGMVKFPRDSYTDITGPAIIRADGNFWDPVYPEDVCDHEVADTGFRKTWCKKCNEDGEQKLDGTISWKYQIFG